MGRSPQLMGAGPGFAAATAGTSPAHERRYWLVGLCYLAGYVALDWISYEYEFAPIGITPWNPPPGLSLALLLREGMVFAPWLFAASALADLLVRGLLPWSHVLASALAIAVGYSAAGFLLRGPLRLDLRLLRLRDMALLIATSTLATALVASAQVLGSIWSGALAPADLFPAILRYWVGDLSGILVLTPLLLRGRGLTWSTVRARIASIDLEGAIQVLALALALWIVFGLESTDEFKFFYLTLLPIIWIALRHGLGGACLASLGAQIGLLLLAAWRGFDATIVTEFQALILLVIVTGLMVGALSDERATVARALHENQDRLAHFSRVSVAGEMVSALAHELSQPLSAASTYLAEGQRLVRNRADEGEIVASMQRAAEQARRASQVVSRLRGFLYRGEMTLALVSAQSVVQDAVALVRAEAALAKVDVAVEIEAGLIPIHVDTVQIQQVIINLVRNAVEAIADANAVRRHVHVTQRIAGNMVEISVTDTGPGLPPEIAGQAFEPFVTTKAKGMGLGLAISRSIVQAHGGQLRAESLPDGATFVILIPRADHGAR